MFDRKWIKLKARAFLKGRYLKAVLVVMVLVFVSTSVNTKDIENMYGIKELYEFDSEKEVLEYKEMTRGYNSDERGFIGVLDYKYPISLEMILTGIGIKMIKPKPIDASIKKFILILVPFIILYPISKLISVGVSKFFICEKHPGNETISTIFTTFHRDEWWNILKTVIRRELYILGGYILLIIPGIIFTYKYSMVPYIMADNPEIDSKTALELSDEMTEGYKWKMFFLDITLIGWIILAVIIGQIGMILIAPYLLAVSAQVYLELLDIHNDK